MNHYDRASLFAIINIVVVSFFLIDTYLIGPALVQETYLSTISETSRAKRGSYINYFIISREGNKYEIPEHVSIAMNVGDTFYINKSGLCGRPMQIIFPNDGSFWEVDVGLINEKIIVKVMVAFIILISILSLTGVPVFKNTAHKEQLVFVSSFLSLVIGFFYFYQ
jgi:hypothetical protein